MRISKLKALFYFIEFIVLSAIICFCIFFCGNAEKPANAEITDSADTQHQRDEFDGSAELSKSLSEDTSETVSAQIIENVPYINQEKRYPRGCEAVATVMALNYYGADISVDEFIVECLPIGVSPFFDDNGIRYGDDPEKFYVGSPYDLTGYGCYDGVIVQAVENTELRDIASFSVIGETMSYLTSNYIDKSIPVIIWVTTDMVPPRYSSSWTDLATGNEVKWMYPMHCVLLTGYDESFYYIHDPHYKGYMKYPKESVETAFDGMGRRAVVIEKKR